jgi:hypothetical protein
VAKVLSCVEDSSSVVEVSGGESKVEVVGVVSIEEDDISTDDDDENGSIVVVFIKVETGRESEVPGGRIPSQAYPTNGDGT